MRVGRGRRRRYYLRGAEFHFGKMKSVLRPDGDDGCTIVCKCLKPLNCTLKNR